MKVYVIYAVCEYGSDFGIKGVFINETKALAIVNKLNLKSKKENSSLKFYYESFLVKVRCEDDNQ